MPEKMRRRTSIWGDKFLALRKSEVAKVAPDRAALMGKVDQDMVDMKEIREADERWLRLLFGEPYEAKFQSGAVHVYDGNGDEVLTYVAGVGWHEKESKAETHLRSDRLGSREKTNKAQTIKGNRQGQAGSLIVYQ